MIKVTGIEEMMKITGALGMAKDELAEVMSDYNRAKELLYVQLVNEETAKTSGCTYVPVVKGLAMEHKLMIGYAMLLGAASIFYPGMAERVSESLGGSFYILPSSVHEVLVVPSSKFALDVKELQELVKSVNANVVEDGDWLSDDVFFYDSSLRKFLNVTA